MTNHNKYYWEVGRNGYIADITADKRIPSYYIGKYHKYEARRVVEDFDLSYNCGTAVTYLLRANRKHDTPIKCIEKAIAHLEFELEKLKRDG
jgi:ribosome-associated translation inhibitor RaiA